MELKGTIRVYSSDGLTLEKVYHNRFVMSGRCFALEALFPIDNGSVDKYWYKEIDQRTAVNDGDPEKRYFDVGLSTEANGVPGPLPGVGGTYIAGTPVLKTSWNGASIFDYTLGSSLFLTQRQEVTIKQRNSRTIEMEMVVNQVDIGVNYIYEMGIFLGMNLSYPTVNVDAASWAEEDRINAMIARVIFYKEDPGDATKWVVDPIYIADNDTKVIRYSMQDV